MKTTTTTTIKQTLLALTIVLSIVSCKKDKKADPAPTPAQPISISDLRALSTGASVKIPDAKKITGIVISDLSSKNIDSKTVVLQDAASQIGIIVTFDAAQTFALGDQVEVTISNQTLAQVNGEIEVTNVPAANAKKTGTGTITAKATTIADINTNKATWDGTLVTIAATELSGGNGKYTGALTLKDASGSTTTNVLAGASFENTAYPVSVSSLTGIVRVNGTAARIDIRKVGDVVIGGITKVITEDFSNVTAEANGGFGPQNLWGGFTTSVGEWQASYGNFGHCYLLPGSTYDADFTTSGRKYVYLMSGVNSYNSDNLPCNFTNLKGLKTLTITFAGSKIVGDNIDLGIAAAPDPEPVKPFDPKSDYFQLLILPLLPSGNYYATLALTTAKYTQAGLFNTITYNIPTKDQMVAAGVDPTEADAYLLNPTFAFYNYSTRAADGSTNAPILFDKVVFGFGN